MRRQLWLLLARITFLAAAALSPISLQSRQGSHAVSVDADGRERIFHGTNAVVKGPPYVPDSHTFSLDISMSAHDFEWMNRLGLNVLRLGVIWAGYEPVGGQYNETYLDEIDRIVRLAADHSIYTLLDMHQDGLSDYFCGEGIPSWAVKPAEGGKLSKPFPAPFDHFDNAQMPDGDTSVLSSASAPKPGNGTIQVVLWNEADSWWKAVTQHRHNKFVREIVSTQDNRKIASGAIRVEDIKNGDQFVLSKAKTLGAHTNVYCIKYADSMDPNRTYTFTWERA